MTKRLLLLLKFTARVNRVAERLLLLLEFTAGVDRVTKGLLFLLEFTAGVNSVAEGLLLLESESGVGVHIDVDLLVLIGCCLWL